MSASDSPEPVTTDIRWTDGALKRMERAPLFLRGIEPLTLRAVVGAFCVVSGTIALSIVR